MKSVRGPEATFEAFDLAVCPDIGDKVMALTVKRKSGESEVMIFRIEEAHRMAIAIAGEFDKLRRVLRLQSDSKPAT